MKLKQCSVCGEYFEEGHDDYDEDVCPACTEESDEYKPLNFNKD